MRTLPKPAPPGNARDPFVRRSTKPRRRPCLRLGAVSLAILISIPVMLFPAQEALDGAAILRRVDENRVSGNKIILSQMIIHGARASRTLRLKSWVQGEDKSFSEYLDPPRERGIKMLKREDQLWTYYPSTDRTILISGHMLRQSVMGSDLSYEDAMEDPSLLRSYDAKVGGEETVLDRTCWVLELEAKKPDIAYHMRKLWVDKERFVPLREERFARSGKLLKTTEVKSVKKMGSRWIADAVVFKDVLKEGKGTEFLVESIEFDAPIPDYIFSKAALKK